MTTALVLLHALASDPGMWRSHTTGPAPVLVPDLYRLADGLTGPPSLDALADRLAAELDRAGADTAALVGCSLGGYLAMAFLRRHPDRVAGLLLISTRADADDPEARARRLALADRITDPALTGAVVDATAPRLLGATTRARRPELLAAVTRTARAIAPADIAWVQRAVAARPDSHAALAAFTGPVVLLAGEEDELVDPAEARRLAAALPGAALTTVPGAGHLLPLEAPDETTAALAALVRERAERR
ncbi:MULTISPECIES: alpha/beta fold hydrolase [Actinosynnema]|uniref:alpha/beta fold hydrolase n=1 Tax=Actinosynnema TaxID=40566 RepID=UPI0020A3939B|nr:alpha/beta hydrolase [Actinosynnema pretiosum]MCP2094778.1 Pimeloyl-ACP methyl ester carboxylesterase [Actinosynnema pretiosum]